VEELTRMKSLLEVEGENGARLDQSDESRDGRRDEDEGSRSG
jgi:hypothetical protein